MFKIIKNIIKFSISFRLLIGFSFFALIFALYFLYSAPDANAASRVYFNTNATSVAPESEIPLELLIDTDTELNVCALTLEYSRDSLKFLALNMENSVFSFLKNARHIESEAKIIIEGGSAKPFVGNNASVAKITFEGANEGVGNVKFQRAECYAADGLGTKVIPNSEKLILSISTNAPLNQIPSAAENDAPVIEDVFMFQNPSDGSRLFSFRVRDESGVRETYFRTRKWLGWSAWQPASSPIKLEAGAIAIGLKITDNFGNETIKTYYDTRVLAKKSVPPLAVLAAAGWFLRFRIQRKKGRYRDTIK